MKRGVLLVLVALLLLAVAAPAIGAAAPSIEHKVFPVKVVDGQWTNPLPKTGARSSFIPWLECWDPPMTPTPVAVQVIYTPDGSVIGEPYWAPDLARLIMTMDENLVNENTRFGVRIKTYYPQDELLRGYVCVNGSRYNVTDEVLLGQTWTWKEMSAKPGDWLALQLPWNGEFLRQDGDIIRRFQYPLAVAYEILPAKG